MPPTLIPYSASEVDLFKPAANHPFFPDERPATDAALCAEMSRLAYSPFETSVGRKIVRDALARIGFGAAESNFFVAERAKGFLASSDSVTVLAFRGTETTNVRDLLTDFDTVRSRWENGGIVHQGFRDAVLQIWPGIAKALEDVKGEVFYTGHSLGAALATLAASLHRPKALYTIGSPRVGDADFIRTLAGLNAERFEDCCDLVCHVPPRIMGFEHFGKFFYIEHSGAIVADPSEAAMKRDQMHARWQYLREFTFKRGDVPTRDLADHAPINYVSALMGLRAPYSMEGEK
jgi:hypothetical protein